MRLTQPMDLAVFAGGVLSMRDELPPSHEQIMLHTEIN
jgi:hypothetical protein